MNNLLSSRLIIDVSDKIAYLSFLAERLDATCLNYIDERVWDIARESKEMPLFCNIYISELFYILESLILDKYDYLDLHIDFYVNSIDSHFMINGTSIHDENDFYDLIDEIEQECELVA